MVEHKRKRLWLKMQDGKAPLVCTAQHPSGEPGEAVGGRSNQRAKEDKEESEWVECDGEDKKK